LYAIGSYVVGRPQDATYYAVNTTLAGTSLYGAPTGSLYTPGQGWDRVGAGGSAMNGNVTLVNTGTWRCMSPTGTLNGSGYPGLYVRIS
jgi:hypothetical protein